MTNNFYGKKIIAACFIMLFVNFGSIGTFGLFVPEFVVGVNSTVSQVALIVTTNCIGVILGGMLATKLFGTIGLKKSALLGTLCVAAHFTMYALTHSIYGLHVAAFIGGIGMALGTTACASGIIGQWYIRDFEKSLGTACAGLGLGSAVFTLLAGQVITYFGYRVAYGVQVVIVLAVAIPVILAMIKTPEELGQKALGADEAVSEDTLSEDGMMASALFKKGAFWLTLIGIAFIGALNINFDSYITALWQEYGASVSATSIYLAVYLIIASLLTNASGVIAEKLKAKLFTVYLCCMFILGIVAAVMWCGNPSLLWLGLTILFISTSYPLYSMIQGIVAAEAYGMKDFTKICAVLTTSFYVGQMLGPVWFAEFLEKTGSYVSTYLSIIPLAVLGIIFTVIGIKVSPYKSGK